MSNVETQHDTEQRVKFASIKSQLATWHADRGNKSIARAMIPTMHAETGEKTTKNPFKLLAMVSPFAWAMFFS
jgi:SHS family lactate transporter-like MFS transporter